MHQKCRSVKPFFDIWAGKEKPKDSENAKKIKRTIFVKFKSILISFTGTADTWSQNEVEKTSNQILTFPIVRHFSDQISINPSKHLFKRDKIYSIADVVVQLSYYPIVSIYYKIQNIKY
jgi:hypothetical protein